MAYVTLTHHFISDDRFAWIAATEIVGIISAVVVVWALMQLSRHFGAPPWAACAAGLLWVVGRRTSGYGADGLSDMLFLALFACSILVALRTRLHLRPLAWFLSGLLAGLSYLTRPEGAAAVIILAFAVLYHYRKPLLGPLMRIRATAAPRQCGGILVMLALGFAIPAAPYMLAIGGFSGKKSLLDTFEFHRGAGTSARPIPSSPANCLHFSRIPLCGLKLCAKSGKPSASPPASSWIWPF